MKNYVHAPMSYKVLCNKQEEYTSNPRNRTFPIICNYPYASYVTHTSISLPFTPLGKMGGHVDIYLLPYTQGIAALY